MEDLLAILGFGIVAIAVLFYIYGALVLMTLAKKTNTDNSWLA